MASIRAFWSCSLGKPKVRDMAKANYYQPGAILLVAGVKHHKGDDRYDSYTGSAEALQRSGILRPDMLPAPGHCSRTWRPLGAQKVPGTNAHDEPGYLKVTRRLDGDFHVFLTVSREEQARRYAERERKDAEWRERMRAHDSAGLPLRASAAKEAEREIARLPKSHAEYKALIADQLQRMLATAVALVLDGAAEGGYTMSRDALDDFAGSIGEAITDLCEGDSYFNASKRAAKIAALRAVIAGADSDFQPFMARLLSPVPIPEDEPEEADRHSPGIT